MSEEGFLGEEEEGLGSVEVGGGFSRVAPGAAVDVAGNCQDKMNMTISVEDTW